MNVYNLYGPLGNIYVVKDRGRAAQVIGKEQDSRCVRAMARVYIKPKISDIVNSVENIFSVKQGEPGNN